MVDSSPSFPKTILGFSPDPMYDWVSFSLTGDRKDLSTFFVEDFEFISIEVSTCLEPGRDKERLCKAISSSCRDRPGFSFSASSLEYLSSSLFCSVSKDFSIPLSIVIFLGKKKTEIKICLKNSEFFF